MSLTYQIFINSGTANPTIYGNGSNISMLEITNSDDQYYQTGFIEFYDVATIHDINDTVLVTINGAQQFKGYVSRREQTIDRGKKLTRYQMVGETYDLWRYHTDENALYSGMTSYIASSLISSYCENIGFDNYDSTIGYNVIDDIDLTNITVGDAIKRLTDLDGYSFYVKNGELYYYKPNTEDTAIFTVTEGDLVGSDPVEESDEDIVNDVLVIGGTGYTTMTNVSENAPSHQAFLNTKGAYKDNNGVLVGQQFTAEDAVLSAVKVYLDATTDDKEPSDLTFEIWENTEKTLFTDNFDNYNLLWNVPNSSNMVKVEDGYLKLSGNSASAITQYSTDITLIAKYKAAQTFKAPASTYVNNATFSLMFRSIQEIEFYITGLDGDGKPDSTNIIDSSQTYTPTSTYTWSDITLNFKKRANLTINNNYALVVCKPGYNNLYSTYYTYVHIKYNSSDAYTDGTFQRYDSTWTNFSSYDTYFNIMFGGYPTTGSIISNVYYEDCQYIKVDLTDTVSSTRVYLSGTNDGGANWKTLVDGVWYGFAAESTNGVAVKYILSSNGNYTPKIGSATVTITDDSGGFDVKILDDDFNDFSNLITSTLSGGVSLGVNRPYFNHSLVYSSIAYRSPLAHTGDIYSGNRFGEYAPISDRSMFDYDLITNAIENLDSHDTTFYPSGIFDTHPTVIGYRAKLKINYAAHDPHYQIFNINGIWVSGTKGTYSSMSQAPEDIALQNTSTAKTYYRLFDNQIFSGAKRIKWKFNCVSDLSDTLWYCYDITPIVMQSGAVAPTSGTHIKSTLYNNVTDIEYLKATWVGSPEPYLTISGTCDNGVTWNKLVNDSDVLMTTKGKQIQLMYCLKASGTRNKPFNNYYIPYIDSCILYGYGSNAGGIPKSGTIVLYSDDISFSPSEVVYPPSYSSWQTYTEPKLKLTEGEKYWMIFEHPSGATASEYWTYYYDPNSTYDGKLAFSWLAGKEGKWSSNTNDPTQVPPGNMKFKLGWTQGDISATATNQDSIDIYGRHFKKISDSSITTVDQAQERADLEVFGMTSIPKKGKFVINGREDISNQYMFSANLTNHDVDEKFDIKSYTQRIDKNGFTTEIVYGKHPIDMAQKIAQLENTVGI